MRLRNPFKDTLHRRLAQMSGPDLVGWTDSALSTGWQAIEAWSSTGERLALDEAHKHVCTVAAIIEELQRRDDFKSKRFG